MFFLISFFHCSYVYLRKQRLFFSREICVLAAVAVQQLCGNSVWKGPSFRYAPFYYDFRVFQQSLHRPVLSLVVLLGTSRLYIAFIHPTFFIFEGTIFYHIHNSIMSIYIFLNFWIYTIYKNFRMNDFFDDF